MGNRCNTLRAGAAPFPGGRGGKLPGADVRRNWPYAAAAGDIESAAAQIDKGVALMRTTGDDWATAMALEIRGHLAVQAGDLPTAASSLREAISMGRRVGDERTVLGAFIGVARLAQARGDHRLTARHWVQRTLVITAELVFRR